MEDKANRKPDRDFKKEEARKRWKYKPDSSQFPFKIETAVIYESVCMHIKLCTALKNHFFR